MPTVKYEPKAGDHLECEHGSYCCWQRWDGVESLDEDKGVPGRHALTVLAVPPENVVEKTVLPTVQVLARALFETDPDVLAFLDVVGDAVAPPLPPDTDWGAMGVTVMARSERAMQIAWNRNERGWRTRATHRAGRLIVSIEDAASLTGSAGKP